MARYFWSIGRMCRWPPKANIGITSIDNLGKARDQRHRIRTRMGGRRSLGTWRFRHLCGCEDDHRFLYTRSETPAHRLASCAVPDTAKGSRLPVTPQFKANATARYKFNVGNFASFAQVAVVHQSSSVPTIEGIKNVMIGTIPGFTTEDFSVGTGMSNWHLEAYIDNAFDSHGELSRGTECGTADCAANYRSFLIKPMNFGIKFGQKF